MGSSLPCFRQSSSNTPRLSEQETKHERSACPGMSFLMLGCLWSKESKERQLDLKEKQQKQELTLEDWLIASPGILQINNGANSGESHVFKHSCKRVFPSSVEEMANSSSSKPRVKSEDGEREDMEVSWSRSQSGKSKKKVSFRLPEESDIFIFHSSSGEE